MNEKKSGIDFMKEIVSFAKTRGFVYPGSEIYGGLANTWDYGFLGVELKKTIKDLWWKFFVTQRADMLGLDSGILLNPKVWQASGHLNNFTDPMIDCKQCRNRFRADKFLEEHLAIATEKLTIQDLNRLLQENKAKIHCPECGSSDFTDIRQFQLMFKTYQGVTQDGSSEIYLRPETAQGIFIQFKNILMSSRRKIPFGVGQIGKSFRNEITPGNFIFRTREFEQMEIEYFIDPSTQSHYYSLWKTLAWQFYTEVLGISEKFLRMREHSPEELAHYSNMTCDIEFLYPFGWGELSGVASRTDYDLKMHQEKSGQDLCYFDTQKQEHYLPYVIEPSFGVDRIFFALLISAYQKENLENSDTRLLLNIKPILAPITVAIFPLKKNEPRIVKLALKIVEQLSLHFKVTYDDAGSIGKLYRRQDEIGTPFCITVDFDSLEQSTVTVRERNTMNQERIKITDLKNYFQKAFI